MAFEAMRKPVALAGLLVSMVGLAACGESSEEKAKKQACTGINEISAQITKLQSLPISTSFPSEAKASVEAINKSIGKVKEAAPNLEPARKEEVDTANKAFQTEIVTITKGIVSAATSTNLQGALKTAEPQIKTALSNLATGYKKTFEGLKC